MRGVTSKRPSRETRGCARPDSNALAVASAATVRIMDRPTLLPTPRIYRAPAWDLDGLRVVFYRRALSKCRVGRESGVGPTARARASAQWILDVVRRHVRVRVNFHGNRDFLSPLLFEYVNAKFLFCTVLRKLLRSRAEKLRDGRFCGL